MRDFAEAAMQSFALTYEGFDSAEEGLREALTSTGNGYLCTRGTAEWEDADGVHYPGTYAHGVYNRETTILGGIPVLNEDREETQRLHLNPLSGRWDPDLSHDQRHVNAAIFYNIWRYFQSTGDLPFLRDQGAEMMLEIARFWASTAHFNPDRGRYEIHGVMGPDEFHEKYPGVAAPGLRNNAYTNVMVAWLCELAHDVLSLLPDTRAEALRDRCGLGDEELRTWEDMSRRMFVPFHGEGIISQFEGYEELKELDWEGYRAKYGNIQRLDRILRAEGDDPNRYKLAKQADTVMLFYLLSEQELRRLFARLGYDYGPDTAAENIAYYDRRTSHGSTLSFTRTPASLRR
jgi:trehalose/maltose hydrolase-like predicted phosphorylase